MKVLSEKKWIFLLTTLVLVGCGSNNSSNSQASQNQEEPVNATIEESLSYYRDKYNVPAMAAVVVKDNKIVEKASLGLRKFGSIETVEENDHWGIGSITKSMTATLSAILVDKGILDWNTTLLEVFPEFQNMQTRYKDTSIEALLSHSTGLPQDDDEIWKGYVNSMNSVVDQRYTFTKEVLAYESDVMAGTFTYSNINYVVVAAMLEKLTDLSFEELLETYLLRPVEMHDTHVNIDTQKDDIWGHIYVKGTRVAIDPSEHHVANAQIVVPAGSRMFTTLDDMGKYLITHLQAIKGNTSLMRSQNAQKLYVPIVKVDEDLDYSLGWFTEGDYGIQHNGSNGRWFALTFINYKTGYGYFVVINATGNEVEKGVYEMMHSLIERTNT
ncbi:MAG: Beta-lactamase [uncultured Sulfurovum sp.]|uniref:Beta-lactamase n=1 Tax=uncultured Sulfurovum sp. TaxID=269237 RepID=A0A6S6T6Q4_9BACT|nr:MAG: Beta-lactamase [uncultured Sulfurovum sp.]